MNTEDPISLALKLSADSVTQPKLDEQWSKNFSIY